VVPNGALHVEKRGGHLRACTLEEIIGRVKQFRVLQHRSVKYARLFRELAFAVLVMVTFHSHFDRVKSNELNHAIVSSLVAADGGGFMAIESHEGVFTWLADTLVPTVFPTTDYNQNDVLLKRGTTSGTRFLQYNKVRPAAAAAAAAAFLCFCQKAASLTCGALPQVFGGVRVKQLRAQRMLCSRNNSNFDKYQNLTQWCYPASTQVHPARRAATTRRSLPSPCATPHQPCCALPPGALRALRPRPTPTTPRTTSATPSSRAASAAPPRATA
jgi:hypothetical protein